MSFCKIRDFPSVERSKAKYTEDIIWLRMDTNFIFRCSIWVFNLIFISRVSVVMKYQENDFLDQSFIRWIKDLTHILILEKISSTYLYSECYSNKVYKILIILLHHCHLKCVNNLFKKIRQWYLHSAKHKNRILTTYQISSLEKSLVSVQ